MQNKDYKNREQMDLVDENDKVIEQIFRDEIDHDIVKNVRYIGGFIINKEGRLWIPTRHPDKKLHPLALDFSVAGAVSSGETYEEAFCKELEEELNLDLSNLEFEEISFLNPFKNKILAFHKIYLIKYDEVPNFNPTDYTSYDWLTWNELREAVKIRKSKTGLIQFLENFDERNIK